MRRRMRMLDQGSPSTASSAGASSPETHNTASREEAVNGTRSSPALLPPSGLQRQLRQLDRGQPPTPPAGAEPPTDMRRDLSRGVN
jgi:hypothetical protein